MKAILRFLAVGLLAGILTAVASAQPVVFAVLDGASLRAAVSPGSLIAIFGVNLAAAPQQAQSVPWPALLGGVSVKIAGVAAPLRDVSANQIDAIIPFQVEIPPNTVVPIEVTSSNGSASFNIRLTRNAPAIFTQDFDGTILPLLFDSNSQPVFTLRARDQLTLYATGLGPVDNSGRVTDEVEVYLGERKAQVLFAGLAPGFPGVYQLNVVAPVPATDRLYLRSGGWQSNIVTVGIQAGANTANVKGSIDGLYPSGDPNYPRVSCVDDQSIQPCGSEMFSIMLHAGTFSVSFDILPSAGPFDVAAVGEAGATIISVDPAARTYTASVSTPTAAARAGDFHDSIGTVWDYAGCSPFTAVCPAFPGPGILPTSRISPFWLKATQPLAPPNVIVPASPNAFLQTSGTLIGSRLVIDDQNNSALSRFGGFVQAPYGPFERGTSTFKLYVDGRLISSRSLPYVPPLRCFPLGPLCWGF